jgi:hypothetical protein
VWKYGVVSPRLSKFDNADKLESVGVPDNVSKFVTI